MGSLPADYAAIPQVMMEWGLHREVQECIWVVAYDADLAVRTVVELARGTLTKVHLHLPTLIAAIVTAGCERFILVHNHPSDRAEASPKDHHLTETVMLAANAAGLYFEDHLILTPSGGWHSMTLAGEMEPVDYVAHASAASPSRQVRSLWETEY